jgi:hypothetical protein
MNVERAPCSDSYTVKTSQVGLGLLGGCAKVKEKVGRGETDRAGLAKLLTQDRALLIVTRFDRLVRSTRDLLNVIAALADRVRHARGRSPESQEAEGRPCRMIF